jgi:hypothetical protein
LHCFFGTLAVLSGIGLFDLIFHCLCERAKDYLFFFLQDKQFYFCRGVCNQQRSGKQAH